MKLNRNRLLSFAFCQFFKRNWSIEKLSFAIGTASLNARAIIAKWFNVHSGDSVKPKRIENCLICIWLFVQYPLLISNFDANWIFLLLFYVCWKPLIFELISHSNKRSMRDETFNLNILRASHMNMCVVYRFMATSISNCAARVHYYVTVSTWRRHRWYYRGQKTNRSPVYRTSLSPQYWRWTYLFGFLNLMNNNAWNILDEFQRIMCCSN